ncbi:MAG: LytTR family DNA-binding domain-containing protein [Bacteroidota bacterium]
MEVKNKNGLYGQPPNLLQGKDYFFLRANKAYWQIRYTDLLYCESLSGGYCRVVTRQETYLYNNTLKVLQGFLPANRFCRIHAGFIVGIDHIAWFKERKLSLHEPPKDGSYKKGYAYRIDFVVGIRYVRSMRAHMLAASSRRGGYAFRTGKMTTEMILEEMESIED